MNRYWVRNSDLKKDRMRDNPKEVVLATDHDALIAGLAGWKARAEELRDICIAVWEAWQNTDNAKDPDVDGYTILQRVKKAALEDKT